METYKAAARPSFRITAITSEANPQPAPAPGDEFPRVFAGFCPGSFGAAAQATDRFAALWDEVRQRLDHRWTLEELARESGCCREVLRRRCVGEFGHSPMQHLTFLRLQHAAALLSSTREKVEYIAATVGYEDAYAFSAMFKRWTGIPPSEFRLRAAARPVLCAR